MLIVLLLSFFWLANADGYTCAQFRHTKDREAFAQTCSVYGLERTLPYWELVGTWSVYSDCRRCGSPFHNFTHLDLTKFKVVKGNDAVPKEKKDFLMDVLEGENDDPTTLCPCCIYGDAPYYDHDFLADEINPKSGNQCERTKYQFTLMGQWKTSHFYAPLSWCFWQTYYVTPN